MATEIFDENMRTNLTDILIATTNEGKLNEFKDLWNDSHLVLHSLKEFPDVKEIPETGATFSENAILKVRGYAMQTKMFTIADDSGLEVAALDNAPGVFSARYGGEGLKNGERIEKLLSELEKIDVTKRQARFICVIAFADFNGDILCESNGVCDGVISDKPRGYNGFGYDSIFIPTGYNETFGELSTQIKRKISHRSIAANKTQLFFNDFMHKIA